MIEIELPYPPTVNTYWGQRGNHRFISKRGREFRQQVIDIITNITLRDAASMPLKGRLAVRVYLYPPDKRKRDIDNILKALLDALEHAGIYENDNQIDILSVNRMKPNEGKCEVLISEIATIDDQLERLREAGL